MMVPFLGNRAVAKFRVGLMRRAVGIKAFDGGGQDKRVWPVSLQAIGMAWLLTVPVVGRRAAARPILNEFNCYNGTIAKQQLHA
ncbi:hypothetical protein SAMN05519103_03291 [Rhizobiales bacterium GAS113]|nr:hypothetical protein SAMN05519103_03291 [Rhizobiales bacterium GAS113]